MKKRKEELAGKIAKELQIPGNALADIPRIEFKGSAEVSVEGCKGIVEYDESVIALNLGRQAVRFRGAGLEITTFSDDQAVITGEVATMEFYT